MTEAVWCSVSAGALPASRAGPGQTCLPDSVTGDEGTNTPQPARELHARRHLQHLMLYRKAESCHLLSQNYQDRGTPGKMQLLHHCRKSQKPKIHLQRWFKEVEGGRRMLQAMQTSFHSLQRTGTLRLLFPRFRRGRAVQSSHPIPHIQRP